jgi:hypothetical protein
MTSPSYTLLQERRGVARLDIVCNAMQTAITLSVQAIQLDDMSLSILRSLSNLCYEFCQSTSAVERIERGSSKAQRLGPVVWIYRSKFSELAAQCLQIFTRYSRLSDVRLLQTRLNELLLTLGTSFDDSSSGYAQRVHFLEQLDYENGIVRGMVDTIIEQQVYAERNQLAAFMFPRPFDQLGQLNSYLSTLSSLSSLCCLFYQSTSTVRRIERGSPRAGCLGPVVESYRCKFFEYQHIFFNIYSQFPGVGLLRARLSELQQTLGMSFDDSSSGYAERVRFLEKLNFENGTLRGVMETIIWILNPQLSQAQAIAQTGGGSISFGTSVQFG